MKRICKECKEEFVPRITKGYNPQKYCSEECLAIKEKRRKRLYLEINRDAINKKNQSYRRKNKEKCNAAISLWQRKNPEKVRERQKRYWDSHPERRKKSILECDRKFVEKMVSINPKYFYDCRKIDKSRFRYLTKLLFKDSLSGCCELCGFDGGLRIHHMSYDYPITIENIIVVCHSCHQKIHGKQVLTGKSIKEIQNVKYHTRRKFRDVLPSYCEICGNTERLHIHHKSYPVIDTVDNLMRLCVTCHQRVHRDVGLISKEEILLSYQDMRVIS